jgi:hypothetical protein
VNASRHAHLFVIRAQDLAGLGIDQMRLGARKALNLNVTEVIVIRLIIRPSLDVVACVGAAVEERRHDLALLFFLAVLE